ncbi:hypothetical protein SSBR45G_67110 [Bradyrhizobium sp. SSBR45G]|uniref:hypothetical protein n=1 Tax=unclassified Bradyrhizobium TaxID=2631580 RepID=UPI0023429036|nr:MULTISPECIES: hypothetical protein [unclassified Bradyrhizobium]GLH81802.1 hypothetical protein SSBR45G_67110 [Bradyrhizobium sp. SSBR45G]GLH85595.1 hypothetical protein SSBR45R_30550 [Bradyrhizobium sp. SSBR45R]
MMRRVFRLAVLLVLISALCPGAGALAQQAKTPSLEDLAKAAQNPIADTISVGLETIAMPNTGPYRQTAGVFKIEPVIPFQLNADWNLVTRTTIPGIAQVRFSPGQGRIGGVGDINQIFALTPSHSGPLIWGLGPTLSYPSATDPSLGSGKWSAGPTIVALTMPGPWVLGVLANNIWSFAGPSDRAPVNQMMLQYFITYNFSDGSYISSSPIINANWLAKGNDRWVVPVGAAIGKLFMVDKQPINAEIGVYYNVLKPDLASRWQFRASLAFLFPK